MLRRKSSLALTLCRQFDSSSTLPGGTCFAQARLSADSPVLIFKGEIIPFMLRQSGQGSSMELGTWMAMLAINDDAVVILM